MKREASNSEQNLSYHKKTILLVLSQTRLLIFLFSKGLQYLKNMQLYTPIQLYKAQTDSVRSTEGLPIFCKHCFFICDHLEEQQTVLLKVEVITNNAPLTYLIPKYHRNMFNAQ